MTPILDRILESTRARVEATRTIVNENSLRERALELRSTARKHFLRDALTRRSDSPNVVAEFKRASPSKGVIDGGADPVETARSYEELGASAISVLTEPEFFKGSLDDLRAIRAAVSLPILRKDFMVDEYQIYEAAEAGADAILLIVAALGVEELIRFRALAEDELGMDVLVEVHTADEMKIACELEARLVGVNNRNLKTFEVSLDVSRDLIGLAPKSATLVSESGLTSRDQLIELQSLGYSAFLIGESLMRNADEKSREVILS